jgi:hypothetical protein
VFTGWTGACTGTGACTVTLTAARMVTATFAVLRTLTVNRVGSGTGTVASMPAGINCGTDCTEDYADGTTVTLTATPAAGSGFIGWTGACSGTGACVVSMTQARSVTANFILRWDLQVMKTGSGTGTVTSSPSGINCGAACTATYDDGALVTLTATPQGASTFSGWSGACTGTGTCVVTMTQALSVTATFTGATTARLTVVKSGPLSGGALIASTPAGINCGTTCVATFSIGAMVTLTATPDGSLFSSWTGAPAGTCTGTGPCTFTIAADTTITANFRGLRIALSAGTTSCLRTAGNALDVLRTRLNLRGHTASFAEATLLDTPAEINQFDVVVLGGQGCNPNSGVDEQLYDGLVDNYLRVDGHGFVAAGWALYSTGPSYPGPNLVAALPTVQSATYLNGTQSLTPLAGHPITAGLSSFTTLQYLPIAAGPKPGATGLLTVGAQSAGAAWSVGAGRTVFLAPMYADDYGNYLNEPLLDGTEPNARELYFRAIEWAAKAR